MEDTRSGGAAAMLLCFTQDHVADARRVLEDAGARSVTTLSASEALSELRRGGGVVRDADILGVTGSPPSDGIGYGIAPVVAMTARSRRVTLIDVSAGSARRMTGARFIAQSMPATMVQAGASGVAIGAQLA